MMLNVLYYLMLTYPSLIAVETSFCGIQHGNLSDKRTDRSKAAHLTSKFSLEGRKAGLLGLLDLK